MLAPNLRSFTIDESGGVKLTVKDCDALRHLSQLDKLVLRQIDVRDEDLVSILENLSGLTALEIFDVSMPNATRILDCIFSMSNLKALAFRPTWQAARQISPPTHASSMQLTKLSWEFKTSLLQTVRLTDITHFGVLIWDESCLDGLVRALESMPNLQWLRVVNTYLGQPLSSCLFAPMRKLKRLDFRRVDVDSAIYQALAALPELTELDLHGLRGVGSPTSTSFHSQINLLTNLRCLGVSVACLEQFDDLLERLSGENLKRLQRLHVAFSNDTLHHTVLVNRPDPGAALFKRLPSLRHFSQGIGNLDVNW